MFKHIVVALDDSDCARDALDTALAIAKESSAKLGICTIVDPIFVVGSSPPGPALDQLIRDLELEARATVDHAVERAAKEGVRASGQVRKGVPAFSILGYAKAFHADLIVMGTHGRRGFTHFVLGSVAEVVLRESTIPVLTVRSPIPVQHQVA
jgi:nucleotide-binding universal stress UspA family protein